MGANIGLIDGLTLGRVWTEVLLPKENASSSGAFIVGACGGMYFAKSGYDDYELFYSTDGLNWARTASNFDTNGNIHYYDGLFIAAGGTYSNYGIRYSTDGIVWSQTLAGIMFSEVYYQSGIWIACGSSNSVGLYYSTNGKSWSRSNITTKLMSFHGHNNGVFVADAASDGMYYSTNGSTWYKSNLSFADTSIFCVLGNGIWVCMEFGGTALYYSTDGKTWSKSYTLSGTYTRLYYENGTFIASGASTTSILYSNNGKEWKVGNITGPVYGMCCANNLILVRSNLRATYYSIDGISWTPININKAMNNYLAYNNGVYLAGSQSNGIIYSVDGKTWKYSNITNFNTLGSIEYNDGVFLTSDTNDKSAKVYCSTIRQ